MNPTSYLCVMLEFSFLFASVCITRRDAIVQSAGLLIGILSLITLLLMIGAQNV